MGNDLGAQPRTQVAQIEYVGEKVILPVGMSIVQAIELLTRRLKFEEQTITLSETFDVFPWDGAFGFSMVLSKKYGWADQVPTHGFFGEKIPPQLINIEIDFDRKATIPWGKFILPNVSGVIEMGAAKVNDRWGFSVKAEILRKDELTVQNLFNEVRAYLLQHSIYRGKAIKIRFRDDDGDIIQMPEPRFLNALAVDENMMVFSDTVMTAIKTNLFTPITRSVDCLRNGIAVKRGVLLGGSYGTGKTMAASVAAKLAVQSGITYIYVPRADELKEAINFAKQYQSPAAVVFCEDIDRVTSGARSVAMDDILNTIDGIDAKTSNIVVVLTTNDLGSIHPAMLRPGRLDAVIEVTPPDAKAVEQLIRLYGGTAIPKDEDLHAVGLVLKGNIPAIVAEVVKRAKLSQLSLQAPGETVTKITAQALLDAAHTFTHQNELLDRAINGEHVEAVPLVEALKDTIREAINEESKPMAKASARAIIKELKN